MPTMDTRLPYFDGQKDFMALINFLDNREEYERYMDLLDKRINKFAETVKAYGKTKDIDRLHKEAESLAFRAKSVFTEREKALVDGEAAHKKSIAEKLKALTEKEAALLQCFNEKDAALRLRQTGLQNRDKAIGEREAAAQVKHEAAVESHQKALKAKREADAMVKRMKAVTA